MRANKIMKTVKIIRHRRDIKAPRLILYDLNKKNSLALIKNGNINVCNARLKEHNGWTDENGERMRKGTCQVNARKKNKRRKRKINV